MGLLSWIILGLIAGVIADFLMGGGFGLIGSIIVGIVGAVVGGWLASLAGYRRRDRPEHRQHRHRRHRRVHRAVRRAAFRGRSLQRSARRLSGSPRDGRRNVPALLRHPYAPPMDLRRYGDVGAFLAAAEPFLVAREAEHNLILGVTSTFGPPRGFHRRTLSRHCPGQRPRRRSGHADAPVPPRPVGDRPSRRHRRPGRRLGGSRSARSVGARGARAGLCRRASVPRRPAGPSDHLRADLPPDRGSPAGVRALAAFARPSLRIAPSSSTGSVRSSARRSSRTTLPTWRP